LLRALAGAYYRGDGLGVNLLLKLGSDGRFDPSWTPDVGQLRMIFNKKALAGEAEPDLEKTEGMPNLPKS